MNKISIGIVTSPNLKERYSACQNTWAKDFEHIYFFGGDLCDDKELIRVPGASEDYNSYFPKQQFALRYMFEKNPTDNFYCVIGCDHILFKDNIINHLEQFDSNIDNIFCQTYNRFENMNGLRFEIFAGGGGFFITNSLMKKIYNILDEFNEEWLNSYQNGRLVESCYACGDVAISYLVKKYFNINLSHVDGMYSQSPGFYPNLVNNPLSFHYIQPNEMKSVYEKFKK